MTTEIKFLNLRFKNCQYSNGRKTFLTFNFGNISKFEKKFSYQQL